MPKLSVSKDTLESKSYPKVDAGTYEVRMDSFAPKKSSKGDSINLNPKMKIVNHATFNDQYPGWENLNTKAGWVMTDFFHCFGVEMGGPDKTELPLEYFGPDDDPSKWQITSPVVGRTGRIEVVQVPDGKGGTKAAIKKYYCAVTGCTHKHTESLV